jgi:hypothetical protein
MRKLNEIIFVTEDLNMGEKFHFFVFQMLQNSNKTLKTLETPKLVIPHIEFPKLTHLRLCIGEHSIYWMNFKLLSQ